MFISLDFPKAFDSVRHTLISKISTFAVPNSFSNWLADYLLSRAHQTTVLENKSTFLRINASIIKGSGLGPVCYVVNCSDLHTVHPTNFLVKYADDTYLIIPSTNSSLIPEELNNITQWASANNLKLNSNKSHEMIVHHSSKKLHFLKVKSLKPTNSQYLMLLLTVHFPSVSTRRTLLLKQQPHFTPTKHSRLTISILHSQTCLFAIL